MSQQEKGELWRKLKAAGVEFEKHYRDYTEDDLRQAWARIEEVRAPAPAPVEEELSPEEAAAFFTPPQQDPTGGRMPERTTTSVPVRQADPNEMPGQRLNQHVELQPIREDEQGRIWYQEEVRKPAYPKPRGRRVLDYVETGTETKTLVGQNGELLESFEVAGTSQRRPAQVKITLPSYQVGIYKDRRFPFKIHVYNGQQGFDLFEVQDYYRGAELVPQSVKRIYVENVLCYDIRTVVRAIETEFRQLQLQGKVK